MDVYSTYVDAVIANGSVNGVYKNRESDKFAAPSLVGAFWKNYWEECNPADYLESVADFNARGLQLGKGDAWVDLTGVVQYVNNPKLMNVSISDDDQCFILKAAADTDTTWEPVVGDEVSTREGVGRIAAIVEQNGEEAFIVQFENEWGVFDPKELRDETEPDYKAGRALRELFISCHSDSATQLGFDALTKPARNAWIEFAKLVKRA